MALLLKGSICYSSVNQIAWTSSTPGGWHGEDDLALAAHVGHPPERLLPKAMCEFAEIGIEFAQPDGVDAEFVAPRVVILDLARLRVAPGALERLLGSKRPAVETLFEVSAELGMAFERMSWALRANVPVPDSPVDDVQRRVVLEALGHPFSEYRQ